MTITNIGKKIFAFVAVVALVLGLVACQKDTQPTVDTKAIAESNVQQVASKINFAEADCTAITANVQLVTGNKNFPDVTITWSSNQPDVLAADGTVNRPTADDTRVVEEGENKVVKVTLTVTVVASYELNGEVKTTDPIQRQYGFSVLALAEGIDVGTIAAVKARAWNYIYVEKGVQKALVSNSSVVYNVKVEGKVTAKLLASGNTKGFMIHDGTEGIYVYGDSTQVNIGDSVEVIGEVYSYYGSLQIGSNVTVTPITKDFGTLTYNDTTVGAWEAAQKDLDDNTIGYLGGKLIVLEGYLKAKTNGNNSYCMVDANTGDEAIIYYKSYTAEMEETLKANVDKYVKLTGVTYDRNSQSVKNEMLWTGELVEATAPQVDDAAQVVVALNGLSVPTEVTTDFELSNVATWTVKSGTAITVDGTTAKVTQGDEEDTVVLVATVTIGEASNSKEFTVKVPASKITLTSLADAIVLCGTEKDKYTTETYYVAGTIISIANTKYGNLTIKDAAGTELYLYGLYDITGKVRYDAMEVKPEVGDFIVVKTVLGYYTAPQGKDARLVASEPGTEHETITVEEAKALIPEADNVTTEAVIIRGILTSVTNEKYGNGTLKDIFGNEMTVYGMYDKEGKVRYDAMTENKPVVGDFVVLRGTLKNYKGTQEIENAQVVELNGVNLEKAPESPDEVLAKVEVDAEVTKDFNLDATVTWTVKEGTAIEIVEGVAKVTRGDADATVVLTATAKVGEVTATKDFTVVVKAKPAELTGDWTAVTVDFSKDIADFSTWANSYNEHKQEFDNFTVTFEKASHQTNYVTNVPVCKNGGYVTILAKEGVVFGQADWTFTQWNTKTNTVFLEYTTDGGSTWTKVAESDTFAIASETLPEGVNGVRISFSEANNQIGIASVAIKVKKTN